MKLTTGQIHSLFVGLSVLERDEAIKLTGDTRLKIAIDTNLVQPLAAAYERAKARAAAQFNAANRELPDGQKRTDVELQADLVEQDAQMRAVEQEVELRTLLKADLRLDDNPKITGATLALIMPIVEGAGNS